jgi:predicted Zn-dependent peptidase
MENLTKKQAIVQSLKSMNTTETEKLINFIKDILYQPYQGERYIKFKEHALDEIRDALTSENSI